MSNTQLYFYHCLACGARLKGGLTEHKEGCSIGELIKNAKENMSTIKIITEGEIGGIYLEDDGCALIAPGLDNDITTGADGCFFVRLQSWDETRTHQTLNSLAGKRVRITLEVVE
jgi:hypothetical protein